MKDERVNRIQRSLREPFTADRDPDGVIRIYAKQSSPVLVGGVATVVTHQNPVCPCLEDHPSHWSQAFLNKHDGVIQERFKRRGRTKVECDRDALKYMAKKMRELVC